MGPQIIFILVSFLTLLSAWVVVTNRNLFHAALALMASFLGVAGLYVLLEAGFLAAAQLLVYIGAISILVIFAIMMTRRLMQTTETPFNSQPLLSGITAIVLFAIIVFVVIQVFAWRPGEEPLGAAPEVPAPILENSLTQLGVSFVDVGQYVLPFEVASVLLLAALVGAIVVAWPGQSRAEAEES